MVVEYEEGGSVASVGGGRHMKEFFPFETWPDSANCPYPTINNSTYAFHRQHGVDTFFVGQNTLPGCNSSLPGNALWDQVRMLWP